MTLNPDAKMEESQDGTEVYNVDPLIVKSHYEIDYIHSYAQDSQFFTALGKKKLMGTKCKNPKCGYSYATPRMHCMMCGSETEWIQLPNNGKIHSYTTCYFGSEVFLPQTPFHLVMVEFEGIDSLFLGRLIGADTEDLYIGMPVTAKFKRLLSYSPTDVYFVPSREAVAGRKSSVSARGKEKKTGKPRKR
ncbi:MAG: Zn-ribbon domain-containing OB-fold protein [Candidatus Thermoplasmatota archaeon]|nr:Zn-ribbon domain-containing OB-fold protein [Candidatus Thermoplasmatota archaeon]MCL5731379.1 Zn-ribbon domain-containing OB-fold protein [Candidatus Thermoplasmatota archaeon]